MYLSSWIATWSPAQEEERSETSQRLCPSEYMWLLTWDLLKVWTLASLDALYAAYCTFWHCDKSLSTNSPICSVPAFTNLGLGLVFTNFILKEGLQKTSTTSCGRTEQLVGPPPLGNNSFLVSRATHEQCVISCWLWQAWSMPCLAQKDGWWAYKVGQILR